MKLISVKDEQAALASICNSKDPKASFKLLGRLRQEHFGYEPHKEIFKRICFYAGKDDGIPSLKRLKRDMNLSDEAKNAIPVKKLKPVLASDVDALLSVLNDHRKARGLSESIKQVSLAFESGKAKNLSEIIEKHLHEVSKINIDEDEVKFSTARNNKKVIKRILNRGMKLVPSGWKAFDKVNGGFPVGGLVVFAANSGGGKCLHGDTLVPTTSGILSLRELRSMSGEKMSEKGFRSIEGVSVSTHKRRYKPVYATYKSKGEIWKLTTKIGEEIKGLKTHKFYTYSDGFQFKTIETLKVGDYIAKSVGTNTFGSKTDLDFEKTKLPYSANEYNVNIPKVLNKDLSSIFAMVVSEGSRCHNITCHDKKLLEAILRKIENVFGVYLRRSDSDISINFPVQLQRFIEHFCGDVYSDSRFVPSIILQSNKDNQVEFLKYLFEGDGTLWRESSIERWNVEYTTVSEKLALQVKAMLENLGIFCSIHKFNTWAANGSSNQVSRVGYNVKILKESFIDFHNIIGFVSKRKNNKLRQCVIHTKKLISSNDINYFARGPLSQVPCSKLAADYFNHLVSLAKNTTYTVTYKNKFGTTSTYSKCYEGSSIFWGSKYSNVKRSVSKETVSRMVLNTLLTRHTDVNVPKELRDIIKNDPDCILFRKKIKSLLSWYWVRVEDVTNTKKIKPVYDLSVQDDRSYTAFGLMSHNTAAMLYSSLSQYRMGYSPFITSFEMDEEELWARATSAITGIAFDRIFQKLLTKKEKRIILEAMEKFAKHGDKEKCTFTIFPPTKGYKFSELCYITKYLKFDVGYYDYASLIDPEGGSDEEWRSLKETSKLMKMNAKATKRVNVLLAQLNDEDKIKYSGGIFENANLLIQWRRDSESIQNGTIPFVVGKARNQKQMVFTVLDKLDKMSLPDEDTGDEHQQGDSGRSEDVEYKDDLSVPSEDEL